MKAPEAVQTERLLLRRPVPDDAQAIFSRFASDVRVTRYVGWPRHETIEATHVYLSFALEEWKRWPAGPYLIERRDSPGVIGSTGFSYAAEGHASTGYVLAPDAWGQGHATEALTAIVTLAKPLGLRRLEAICHPDNVASLRVLEKCGFANEGRLPRHSVFPNLDRNRPLDVLRFARSFSPSSG